MARSTKCVWTSFAMRIFIKSTDNVTPFYHFELIKADPDDNKFVDCAVAGNAKFIVTEDHHYDILANIAFPHVDIVNLDEMMKFFGE